MTCHRDHDRCVLFRFVWLSSWQELPAWLERVAASPARYAHMQREMAAWREAWRKGVVANVERQVGRV